MRWPKKISLLFANQVVLSLLALIILAHVVTMFFYLRESSLNRQALKRNDVIQKIINAIYTVEATPLISREKAVSAMEDPDINVTLTASPKSTMQFQSISYWNISRALRGKLGSFNLSIEMGPGQWLNIKATIYNHFLYTQMIFFLVEILIFATIFTSAWSIRRFTQPLKKFKAAAEQLGIDLHSSPLDIYGPPVVKEAAEAINKMQFRIQDLIRDRTQMLAAISHDLRTPITRMKLRSQFLNDQVLQSKFIHDLDEMSDMISEVLAFARQDSNVGEKKNIDLISFLDTIIEEYRVMQTNIDFDCSIYRLPIQARPVQLKRALNNIINNARRYANHIKISLKKSQSKVVVFIDDDGPGIPPDEIENVFKPFYRGEKSRNRDTGGVGLGLAVTQHVILSHGGWIRLRNRRSGGLSVMITLPLQA